MNWLQLLARTRILRSSHRRAGRQRRLSLQLESLEERTLLNNRFVVPLGTPVDNQTNFATLHAALTTPGLAPGNTIQIEPGSSPGNVVNADFPALANLTIQGDPALAASALPQFTCSDAITITALQRAFTLRNVNVGLVAAGSLTLTCDGLLVTGSIITDVSSTATAPFAVGGQTTSTVTSSTFVQNSSTVITTLVSITSGVGFTIVLTGNTFAANTPATTLVQYFGPTLLNMDNDRLANNLFIAEPGSHPATLFAQHGPGSGLMVQNNTFTGQDNGIQAIGLFGDSGVGAQTTTVDGNIINLTGASTVGIIATAGSGSVGLVAAMRNNRINTGGLGNGIEFDVSGGAPGSGQMVAHVEGNDLHGNRIGVLVNSSSTMASVARIDLGGGSEHSIGDNNFRSFTTQATASAGAIVTNSIAAQGNISARSNIFASGINPETVTFDSSENATLSDVDEANALSANASFVESLYLDFLKRIGDTTNSGDAGSWVNALNAGTLTPAQAAADIIRSPEALGVVVDGLYQKILGRASDSGGRSGLVSFLQHGGTVEQASAVLTGSEEFNILTGSDGGFVQGLYVRFLGRTASNGEVGVWINALPNLGRMGVANAILSSAEFRSDVVQQLYGFTPAAFSSVASLFPPLLHRPSAPGSGEISSWANSRLDVFTITVVLAGSGEFFTNG